MAGGDHNETLILPLVGNNSDQLDQSTIHLSQSFLDNSMNMNLMNTYQQEQDSQQKQNNMLPNQYKPMRERLRAYKMLEL